FGIYLSSLEYPSERSREPGSDPDQHAFRGFRAGFGRWPVCRAESTLPCPVGTHSTHTSAYACTLAVLMRCEFISCFQLFTLTTHSGMNEALMFIPPKMS